MPQLTIHQGDNLPLLATLPSQSIDLIYIDPPFNTGTTQRRTQLKTSRAHNPNTADRTGFQGKRYQTQTIGSQSYPDHYPDLPAFLKPRLQHAKRILKANGSLFFHIDYRESHYCKILLDQIFGRASFLNEIIWAYDYGARTKKKWPAKHDTIFWYANNPQDYQFHLEEADRIPYMAPALVGAEKAAKGKTPTDTWWHTIVSPTGKEKTGYPTQKPLGILQRIIKVHSRPDDHLLDFFAGSGSFGAAAHQLKRHCTLIDQNPQAITTMQSRFAHLPADQCHWHLAKAD